MRIKFSISSTLVAALALLASCDRPKEDIPARITVTGQVLNFEDTSAVFTYDPFEFLGSTQKVDVRFEPGGSFRLELESAVPLKGFISFGRVPKTYQFNIVQVNGRDSSLSVESADFRMVYLWLEPGDSLMMVLDATNIEGTLSFSGLGAANSRFVNQEALRFDDYKHRYLGNYYHFTFREPDDFKRVIDDLRQAKMRFLAKYPEKEGLSTALLKVYQTGYLTEAVRKKLSYPGSHEGFNNGRAPVLPDDYYAFLDSLPEPEAIGPLGTGYFYFLNAAWHRKFDLESGAAGSPDAFYDYLLEKLPGRVAYEFLAYSLPRDFRKILYDRFGPGCPYPDLAATVKEKYQPMEGMLEGSPAPEVTLEDVRGNPVSLAELRGTFIYIDFWATWCAPCIKEIPFLQEVEKAYHGKNIRFVSLSFDKEADREKWRNYVKDNDLTGIQLLAGQEAHDLLSKTFNIDLIPRFILLDPQGRVVSANAPRPSSPGLIELFKRVGIDINSDFQNVSR
ncbi:MAG: TlpA disulfide reductase family protein [Bacteroidales bacterium]